MQERFFDWLYPELRQFNPQERQQLLSKANEGNFDLAEVIGLAIALALTVVLTRYSVAELTFMGRFASVLFNFIIAIPLLLVLGVLSCFRRTRRHLLEQIRQRKSGRLCGLAIAMASRMTADAVPCECSDHNGKWQCQ